MKIFGLILGCPESVRHCMHLHGTRIRPRRVVARPECKEIVLPRQVNQERERCCLCEWITPWLNTAVIGK